MATKIEARVPSAPLHLHLFLPLRAKARGWRGDFPAHETGKGSPKLGWMMFGTSTGSGVGGAQGVQERPSGIHRKPAAAQQAKQHGGRQVRCTWRVQNAESHDGTLCFYSQKLPVQLASSLWLIPFGGGSCCHEAGLRSKRHEILQPRALLLHNGAHHKKSRWLYFILQGTPACS